MKRSTKTNVTFMTTAMMLALSAGQAAAAPGEIRVVDRALLIEGLDDWTSHDMIEVVEDGPDLWVRYPGVTVGGLRFPIADVDEIKVNLWAGNDTFQAPDIDLPMTVYGGWGNDHISTGPNDDFVFGDGSFASGKRGDDTISSNGGNDFVVAGDGLDTVNSGSGNDTVYGFYDVEPDEIEFCYQDADVIDAGPGSDYVEGGPDNDEIFAGLEDGSGSTVDTVYGYVPADESLEIECSDIDTITAGGGSLVAYAGPDDDFVFASDFADVLSGGSGDDLIYAYGDSDSLTGGKGEDMLDCGEGNDFAEGGDGDDEIFGRDGDDTLKGNAGSDTIWGEAGEDTLNGGDNYDLLDGGSENDVMMGGSGDDTMYGREGDDEMYGYIGHDVMYGHEGNDKLWGNNGDDSLDGGPGDDRLDGGDGSDYAAGYGGADELIGGVNDDDNDILWGGEQDDRLYGGGGEDDLFGGEGDDLLVSVDDEQDDYLSGGNGFDSFWYDRRNRDRDFVSDMTDAEEETNMHEVRRIRNFDDYTWDGDDITDMSAGRDDDGVDYTYADFSGNELFGSRGPELEDVNQGSTGSCWLLAGLGAVAEVSQNAIKQAIIPLPDGSFMMQWGNQHYRHDADLPTKASGGLAYARQGHDGSLWVAMMEKMVADQRFSVGDISFWNEYNDVAFGTPSTAFRKMGGDGRSILEAIASEIFGITAVEITKYVDRQIRNNEAVAVCTPPILVNDHLYKSHCYTVLRVIKNKGLPTHVELYNPWGVDINAEDLADGSKSTYEDNDGIVRITIREFSNTFISVSAQVSISDFSDFDE